MSLDIELHTESFTRHTGSGIFIRKDGSQREITRAEWNRLYPGREPVIAHMPASTCAFSANITHNLNKMAAQAGIYHYVWRPEEMNIERAEQLIVPLTSALETLRVRPDLFTPFNPPNRWGNYDIFVEFIEKYREACMAYPDAKVIADR